MEFKRAQEIAVVLLLGIACAILWFISEWVFYTEWAKRFFSSHRKIEWLREIITHVMLYGVAAASGFGIAKDSGTMLSFAGAWFLGSIWLGYQLSCLLVSAVTQFDGPMFNLNP